MFIRTFVANIESPYIEQKISRNVSRDSQKLLGSVFGSSLKTDCFYIKIRSMRLAIIISQRKKKVNTMFNGAVQQNVSWTVIRLRGSQRSRITLLMT